MKKIAQVTGIFLLAVLFVFGVAACDPSGGDKSSEALLTKLILADEEAILGQPISEAEWNSATTSNFAAAKVGDIIVLDAQFLNNADIELTISGGASAKYSVQTSGTAKPTTWTPVGNTITLSDGNSLYIQVTAENGTTINYYKIQVAAANNMVTLGEVKVGSVTASNGTGSTTWGSVTNGELGLSSVAAQSATLSIKKGHISQTISFAKVEKATGITTAPTTWTVLTGTDTVTTTVSVTDGDFLCIKVVSGDGSATSYYIIQAQVGWNADITNIKFGATTYSGESMGIPAATAVAAEAGEVLMELIQPTDGFVVSATVAEEGATYKLVKVTGAGDPDFSSVTAGQATIQFADGDFLCIEVTAGNGTTKQYYKVQVQLVQVAEIKYGMPEITNGTLDPMWADVEDVYKIEKLFPRDTTDSAWGANPDTKGEAKALWDDRGLYVYWKVTDPTNDSSGSQHTADSIELFINEAYLPGDTANKWSSGGSQYRVGRDKAVSGNPSGAVTALNNSGKFAVWEWGTAGDPDSGYIVTMYVPWRFVALMHVDGEIPDNKMFGMELQINARACGGRKGTVVWNNIASTNYERTQGFGIMTLVPPEPGQRKEKAETPEIDVHPVHANYAIGASATALSVSAEVERGELSYQWWSTTENATAAGSAISGANSETYMPLTTTDGRTWYWCVITNTDSDAAVGFQTATAISNRARVTVIPTTVETKTFNNDGNGWKNTSPPAGNNQYAVFFTINFPADFDVSLYTNFVINFKMYSDATTEITTFDYGKAQYNWNLAGGGVEGVYNFGADANANSGAIPTNVLNSAGVLGITFETSDNANPHVVQYLEVTSIVFSKQ